MSIFLRYCVIPKGHKVPCHCEERSDEAISRKVQSPCHCEECSDEAISRKVQSLCHSRRTSGRCASPANLYDLSIDYPAGRSNLPAGRASDFGGDCFAPQNRLFTFWCRLCGARNDTASTCHCEPRRTLINDETPYAAGRSNLPTGRASDFGGDCFAPQNRLFTFWCRLCGARNDTASTCHCEPRRTLINDEAPHAAGRSNLPAGRGKLCLMDPDYNPISSLKSFQSGFMALIRFNFFRLEPAFICFSRRIASSISPKIS